MPTSPPARLCRRTLIFAPLIAVTMAGCATRRNDQPYRAYTGPERPESTVAVVKTVLPGVVGIPKQPNPEIPLSGYLKMVSVDGTPTSTFFEPHPPRLDLPPGKHTIDIELTTSTAERPMFVFRSHGSLTAAFQAGVVYILDVRVNFKDEKAIFYLRAPRAGER